MFDQHKENLERIQKLRDRGFEFTITADGYSVKLNGVFLGGASVKLPRTKRLHWRHREANFRSNVEQCLLIADNVVCRRT